jgi:hypothetical protein
MGFLDDSKVFDVDLFKHGWSSHVCGEDIG